MKGAYIYHNRVDTSKLDLKDYGDIVSRPIDFGSIKQKLSYNQYKSKAQFLEDIDLYRTSLKVLAPSPTASCTTGRPQRSA